MRIIRSIILFIGMILINSCRSGQQDSGIIHLSAADSVYKDSLRTWYLTIRSFAQDSAVTVIQAIKALEDQYDPITSKVRYYNSMVAHYTYAVLQPNTAQLYADSLWDMLRSGELVSHNQEARVYYTRGMYYIGRELYDSAIYYNLQTLSILKPPVDSTLFYGIYETISGLYAQQKNFEKAFFYYRPIIEQAEQLKHPAIDVYVLINAFCYAFPSDNDSIKNLGGIYLFKAKHIIDSLHPQIDLSKLYNNLSYYYAAMNKPDSARYYGLRALKNYKEHPVANSKQEIAYYQVVSSYTKQKDYPAAFRVFKEMQQQTDTGKYSRDNLKDYYELAYLLARTRGTPTKALLALERHTYLLDEINKYENDKQLQNYDTRMKELANENFVKAKEYEAKNQRYYIILLTVIVFLTLISSVYVYFYWKKKRLLAQREQEYKHQNQLLEERNRISREMHDDLGTTLTSTLIAIEMLEEFPDEKEHLHLIRHAASNLHQQVNDIIWNLNIQDDNIRSLNNYMILFAKDFLTQAQIAFQWEEDIENEDKIILALQRRPIYLSFKELIHNIVKHARATEVKLYIRASGNHYHLSVSDNGIGQGQSKQSDTFPFKGGGYGLQNISRNIEKICGKVKWMPCVDTGGTKVSIDISIIAEVNE